MSVPGDNYIMVRNDGEVQRLEKQHALHLQCQGYHLHPDIQITQGARVAELATGTGIWLRELSKLHPSAECHGFDISSHMFPANSDQNVQLHVHDIKKPFAEQWHGYFDAVHIRFVQAAMNIEDWSLVVKSITQILKPGGWLQWGESDAFDAPRKAVRGMPEPLVSTFPFRAESAAPFRPTTIRALSTLASKVVSGERAKACSFGFQHLEELFGDPGVGGLEDIFVDCYAMDAVPSLRKAETTNLVTIMIDIARKAGNPDADQMWSEVLKEIEAGAYFCLKYSNFIGRKAE